MSMKLSVVIPAYDESGNIGPTVEELCEAIAACAAVDQREIIVVDDHSRDGTFEAVAALGRCGVHCLRLSRRSGSHVALRAGLEAATGDAVLCVSADGQDSPAILGTMLERWTAGAQTVWGLRRGRSDEPWTVKMPSRLFYRVLRALAGDHGTDVDLSRADFFLVDRRVVEAMRACCERNTSLFGLLAWAGFRQEGVEYDRRQRRSGESKWAFRSRLRLATDWIFAFSNRPLRLLGTASWLLALAALAVGLVAALGLWRGPGADDPGHVAALVLLVGALQLAALRLAGDLVWRALDEARRRPLYFVERSTLPEAREADRTKGRP